MTWLHACMVMWDIMEALCVVCVAHWRRISVYHCLSMSNSNRINVELIHYERRNPELGRDEIRLYHKVIESTGHIMLQKNIMVMIKSKFPF